MNTVKKLIKSIYRDLKSDTQKRKAVKGEKRFSKKPVDPAEQRYKQKRSIERSENKVYDEDWDSFDASEAVRRYSAKQYLRKSRRGETTKEDIDHRINHKRKGEYDNIDLGYERKRRKDKKFWGSVNKRLRDKGIDPHVFDDDTPF